MPDRKCFYRSKKDGTTGDDGKKLDGHISHEEYLMCEKIWNEFCMKNMGDYHDEYLKKRCFVISWCFRKFLLGTCLKFYGFDPFYYFGSPGLSWDAMLKMTTVKLEKMSDIDMYLFIKKGLRGGISYNATRYAKVIFFMMDLSG